MSSEKESASPHLAPIAFGDNGSETALKPTDIKPDHDKRTPDGVYGYTYADMSYPFWKSSTMRNEIFTFQKNDETGEITAKLLFTPKEIISVKDNSLTFDLKEGVHYARDAKDSRVLRWLPGDESFCAEYFTTAALSTHHTDNCGTSGNDNGKIGNAMYCVGSCLYNKQLHITYTYDLSQCQAPVTGFRGNDLPKTMEKLRNKEELTVVIYGDSIFTGCDSSAAHNRAPHVPTFFYLFKNQLESLYQTSVRLIDDVSLGGANADWGVENADAQVNPYSPDLVVLGFGMNDAWVKGDEEAKKMASIMATVKAKNPNCEFIVVSTFVANPTIGWDVYQGTHYEGYKTLETTGVVTMDMHRLHEYLLQSKYYQDMTGNNINHPNDWLARMYAMQLLSLVYPF